MAGSKSTKSRQATVIPITEIRERVDRIRKDVEEAVETIGKRAVDSLPESSRKQVDGLLDRVNAVSGDVNKTVDEWRGDLGKRVSTLRKETESRRKKFVTNFEKQTRRYVERVFKHPKYNKYIRRHTKYLVHDEENTAKVGDTVEIAECRPMSKTKRWRLVNVLERPVDDGGAV